MNKSIRGLEYLPMLLSIFLWSGTYIAGKFAISELSTMNLMLFRYVTASIIMLPFIAMAMKGRIPGKKDTLLIIATGITGMFGNNVMFFMAIKYTSVMNASIIFATAPLLTAILASIFLDEPITGKRLIAIVVALIGVILLITGGNIETIRTMQFNRGDLYELGAALCAATFTIIATKVTRYSPVVVITYGMITTTILTAITVTFMGSFSMQIIMNLSPLAWKSIAYLVVGASCIAYLMQQLSIKLIGPNRTAAFVNLSPAITMAMAAYFLGERISPIQCVSALIIVAGVAMNASTKKGQSRRECSTVPPVHGQKAGV